MAEATSIRGSDRLTGWPAGWLTGWVTSWLTGWLAGWLAGWPAGQPVNMDFVNYFKSQRNLHWGQTGARYCVQWRTNSWQFSYSVYTSQNWVKESACPICPVIPWGIAGQCLGRGLLGMLENIHVRLFEQCGGVWNGLKVLTGVIFKGRFCQPEDQIKATIQPR